MAKLIMMMRGFLRVLSVLALAASAPIHAQVPPQAPAASSAPAPQQVASAVRLDDGYVLGSGDVVEIVVLGRDEFRPRVQVQVDGTVQLPYLHSVKASDLTVIQLRDRVARLLRDGGYFVDPVVSVTVVSYASRYVTVLGEFGTPGLLPVDRAYRVSEILARAGGAKPGAGDTLVLRRADGQSRSLPIAAISAGGPEEDPLVQPGDKLYIAPAPLFYIYGQVTAPGSYRVERGMTLRMALARGGGLTDRGSTSRISVYRDGKKIASTLDMPIRGDDTVVIGERFF